MTALSGADSDSAVAVEQAREALRFVGVQLGEHQSVLLRIQAVTPHPDCSLSYASSQSLPRDFSQQSQALLLLHGRHRRPWYGRALRGAIVCGARECSRSRCWRRGAVDLLPCAFDMGRGLQRGRSLGLLNMAPAASGGRKGW